MGLIICVAATAIVASFGALTAFGSPRSELALSVEAAPLPITADEHAYASERDDDHGVGLDGLPVGSTVNSNPPSLDPAPAAPRATSETTQPSAVVSGASTTDPAAAPSTTETRPTSTAATPTSTPPTTAPEVSTTTPPAGIGHQQRGEQALARITYPWQSRLSGWAVEFRPERQGYYGLTMVDEQRIEIYVRADQSDGLLAHVIAHEIGHAVDVTLNSGDDRRRWQEARGIDDAPWWPSAAATDFSTGAGDFAESFAFWQVGGSSFRSKLGGAPDSAQQALLAELSQG